MRTDDTPDASPTDGGRLDDGALPVVVAGTGFEAQAGAIAAKLGTVVAKNPPASETPYLTFDKSGLSLASGNMVVRGDFAKLKTRLKPGRLAHEMVVRAARGKRGPASDHPTAIDATAGLGDDSLLLAAAGFDVTMYERDPVIAALLSDALERARTDDELAPIVGRMHLMATDSIAALGQLESPPDVVLLDPMFPAKKKSAQVKKKLQAIQHFERPCEDEDELLQAALGSRPRKIIVKRPVKGPHLAGVKPAYAISGKAIRFDCYIP